MTDAYMLVVTRVQIPKIIQGTMGRVHLTISDIDGKDVDLDDYDELTLILKNYPEEDNPITRVCYVSADDDTICYFDFTVAESIGWLSSPYFGELTLKRYVRDKEVAISTTGYVPEKSFMNFSNCTSDFVVGEIITGAVSGETAVVYSFEDCGGIGELELIKVSGAFTDEEEITGPGGGSAYVVVGVNSTEYLVDRFADDSKDFAVLGVAAKDEITIEADVYTVSGYDSVAIDWIVTEEENGSPGTGVNYTVNTINDESSATDALLKTLPFALYIKESI